MLAHALLVLLGHLVELLGEGLSDVLDLTTLAVEFTRVELGLKADAVEPVNDGVDLLVEVVELGSLETGGNVGGREGSLDFEGVGLKVVLLLGELADLAIFLGSLGGVTNHALNLWCQMVRRTLIKELYRFKAYISVRETAGLVGDNDRLGNTGGLVLGGNVEDTVGVDGEGNVDLGDTTLGGRDTLELELTEGVVGRGNSTLTLEDTDVDTSLVVGGGRELLGLLDGDGGVTLDDSSHQVAFDLNTEGKRSDIEEENVSDGLVLVAGDDGSLRD